MLLKKQSLSNIQPFCLGAFYLLDSVSLEIPAPLSHPCLSSMFIHENVETLAAEYKGLSLWKYILL